MNNAIRNNVFYKIYHERNKQTIMIKKTIFQRLIYSIILVLIFFIALFHTILGLIIFVICKLNYPKEAKWPKLGLLLGLLINFYMFYLQLKPLI